jgi:serine protease AprX
MKPLTYLLIITFFLFFSRYANAQEKLAPNVYMIRFTDKNQNSYQLTQSDKFLSQRALQRRLRQSISLQENDLPVSNVYVDSLKKMGVDVFISSKWLNAVCVRLTDTSVFSKLRLLSFVKPTLQKQILKSAGIVWDKFEVVTSPITFDPSKYYGSSLEQIDIHDGVFLHKNGFRGQGMLIAILDGGFNNANGMKGLDSLWKENRVTYTRDFVQPNGDIFQQAQHGSNVLSIMAAISPGYLVGTAPKASYALILTENSSSEYPLEEFNWAAGAELADSIGADIINTSLGYTTFDDPSLNHTYADMNGRTALSSIAANIASSKGIIVVASAGNEGNNSWRYISAPADADSILTIGAIDVKGKIASFSSRGPTYDKRIKPDVVAVGSRTVVETNNSYVQGSGTSFSAPIISGLTACLWQACPDKNNMEIIRAIQQYSSQFATPDSIKGYGIPNFKSALYALNPSMQPKPGVLCLFPNPFTNQFRAEFDAIPEGIVNISIYDISGRKLLETKKSVSIAIPNTIIIDKVLTWTPGMYVVKIFSESKHFEGKIIKQ